MSDTATHHARPVESPSGHHTPHRDHVRLGGWPGELTKASFVVPGPGDYPSSTYAQLLFWETMFGEPFSIARERGRVGQVDTPMVKDPTVFDARLFSGNFNLRTGVGSDKVAVTYAHVLAGGIDRKLAEAGAQLAGLHGINEVESEANVRHAQHSAQPDPGTPAQYQQAAPYIRQRLIDAGAGGVLHGMSLTCHLYESREWENYYWEDCDFIAADGYRDPRVHRPVQVSDFYAVCEVGLSLGKRVYLTEVGSMEPGKAFFLDGLRALADKYGGAPLHGIFLNLSADGPSREADPPGWAPTTSQAAWSAALALKKALR